MRKRTEKLYLWAQERAASKRAPFWMALLFFLEILLFLPLDALFVFFSLQDKRKIFLYAAIAVVASTLSGLIGYSIGYLLWDWVSPYLIPHWIGAASFAKISHQLQMYEEGAVFLGALLPFPLKILSLAAGVFHLHPLPFLAALLTARVLRFFSLGTALALWGERIKAFLDRHFRKFFLAIGLKVAVALSFLWALSP